jgi:predicted flap endonuclease-1-like 5' DNA nuclease
MKVKMHELKGVTEETANALKTHEVHESDKFLAAAGHPKERAALAAKLGIDEKEVLELANRADLARIKGIGKVYADLLEHAGVDSVIELRNRKPENLFQKLTDVGAEHGVKRLPRLDEVQDWVTQAKTLDRAVHH